MSTTHSAAGLGRHDRLDAARLQLLQEMLGCVSGMAQTRRSQAELCGLSDRGLMDIGITRGEIE